jgi:structure-specific endonuclease subunit SLX1
LVFVFIGKNFTFTERTNNKRILTYFICSRKLIVVLVMTEPSSFYVYLLSCVDNPNLTYVGATVDLDRRLRQHNGEIKGGARRTGMQVKRGDTWERVCHVAGFPDWKNALSFEWAWKYQTRLLRGDKKKTSLDRRMLALQNLISLDRPTSKALLYADWNSPPQIVFCENPKFSSFILPFRQ